jgi:hypothetical protein
LYEITIAEAIAACIDGVEVSNFTSLSVTPSTVSAVARRALRAWLTLTQVSPTTTIHVNYTISLMTLRTYSYYSSQLRTAVLDGTFTTNLRLFAIANGVTGLYDAASSNVTLTNGMYRKTVALDDDSLEYGIYQLLLIPIVLGGSLILIVCAIGIFCWRIRRNAKIYTEKL